MAFTTLLEATQPPEDSRAMLSYRIEVKMAHASLLTRATFGTDAKSARRAERLTVELATMEEVNPPAVTYLNRLSDWLFCAARIANDEGRADVLWKPGANR